MSNIPNNIFIDTLQNLKKCRGIMGNGFPDEEDYVISDEEEKAMQCLIEECTELSEEFGDRDFMPDI